MDDAVLVMEAKVRNVRRSGDDGADTVFMRVNAEKIYDLNAARNRFARGMRLICNGQSSAQKLRDLLAPYRNGPCPVSIAYHNRTASCEIQLGDDWRVNINENLLQSLSAWLSARTTMYTLTNKRVVMRIGIVLTVSFNLPLRAIRMQIASAVDVVAQIERMRDGVYADVAQRLLDSGAAYYCYCSTEELEARREQAMAEKRAPGYDGHCRDLTEGQQAAYRDEGREPVVRFRMPGTDWTWDDLVRGPITFAADQVPDFVLVRANGEPLYTLVNPVDDALMRITEVVRGAAWMTLLPASWCWPSPANATQRISARAPSPTR